MDERIAQDRWGRWWYNAGNEPIDGNLIGKEPTSFGQPYGSGLMATLVGPFESKADAEKDLAK